MPNDARAHVTEDAGRARKGQILAWGLWDWASSGFNTVIVTFVFSVYLTGSVGDDLPGPFQAGTWYTASVAVAGLFIALLAPVVGQRADAGGRRKRALAVFSAAVCLCMLGLFFVRDDYRYFFLGAALIGLGSVFFEIASVFYNSMLRQVSTPANIGQVSGFGWSMGYFGGIFLLLICYYGFVSGSRGSATKGLLGISTGAGLNIRLVALVAAVWFAVAALPLFFAIPEIVPATQRQPGSPAPKHIGVVASYRMLFDRVRRLIRTDRPVAMFLLASAIFRDGLAAVFHFGAILAVLVYGLSSGDVLVFGVAANVVAALGALGAGFVDDRVGPRAVIIASLVGLLVTGGALIFASGPAAFWVFGLILCLFVGPAQSASRTYLARMARPGGEGEVFGLYATTGRAVSFLSPALYALSTVVFGGQRYGTVGIMVVLAAGLVVLLRVPRPVDRAADRSARTAA